MADTSSFWKNSGRAVPGRPSPKKDYKNSDISKVSSFNDYQNSVSDAWDTGDDEFCILTGMPDTFSKNGSLPMAVNVIQTHRKNIYISKNKPLEAECRDEAEPCNGQNTYQDNQSKVTGCFKDSATECKSSSDNCNPRQYIVYPGRPQLQKRTGSTHDSDKESKIRKFKDLLEAPLLDLLTLKQLSWSGIPEKMRPITWRLLSKYLPTCSERKVAVLKSKRQGYQDLRNKYFYLEGKDDVQQDTFRQIHIDVPRMNPHILLFQQKQVQQMFERILFIWAIRHPASGYVQGINDLVTPFFIVFLQENTGAGDDFETLTFSNLTTEALDAIEADSFWCLSKFLDCIQDNYIFAQLGIQEKVNQLKDIVQRVDGTLHKHLQCHGVDYLQFSFRWMNNLLTRELPLKCTIRLWDTYLAESDAFAVFHLYVCAAFLLHWRDQLLQQNDFQGLMTFLQNLPTYNWSVRQIDVLVAEAFRLKFTYADAPKHLEGHS